MFPYECWPINSSRKAPPKASAATSLFARALRRLAGSDSAAKCNFAGIGATNNSPVGKGARLGVRAQIQHLKAYANDEALVNECVDPRFGLVTRGAAGNKWTGLNGRWAVPGKGYGESILALWEEMYNFCIEEEEEGPSTARTRG